MTHYFFHRPGLWGFCLSHKVTVFEPLCAPALRACGRPLPRSPAINIGPQCLRLTDSSCEFSRECDTEVLIQSLFFLPFLFYLQHRLYLLTKSSGEAPLQQSLSSSSRVKFVKNTLGNVAWIDCKHILVSTGNGACGLRGTSAATRYIIRNRETHRSSGVTGQHHYLISSLSQDCPL